MIGVDTGFFFALREGNPLAHQVLVASDIAVSVITRFELRRLALRRGLDWDDLWTPLARSATILDVTGHVADEAARISSGTGLPALDALILASLLAAGCRTIYTKDEHFLRFTRKDVEIVRLD